MDISKLPIQKVLKRWPKLKTLEDMFGPIIWNILLSDGWVAGGCIRAIIANEQVKDIDVFFKNEQDFMSTKKDLMLAGGKIVRRNSNIVDMYFGEKLPKVQLIQRYFDTPEDCLRSFDFTVTMFAMTKTDFYMGAFSLHDLEKKRLVINEMPKPLSSTGRLLKYLGKGYEIDKQTLQEIADIIKQHGDQQDYSIG